METVSLCDGKYTFVLHDNGRFECLRHGEKWRDFAGDKAVFALFQEVRELQRHFTATSNKALDELAAQAQEENMGY